MYRGDLYEVLVLDVAGLAKDKHGAFVENGHGEIAATVRIPLFPVLIGVEDVDRSSEVPVLERLVDTSAGPGSQQRPAGGRLGHSKDGNVNEDFALVELVLFDWAGVVEIFEFCLTRG